MRGYREAGTKPSAFDLEWNEIEKSDGEKMVEEMSGEKVSSMKYTRDPRGHGVK